MSQATVLSVEKPSVVVQVNAMRFVLAMPIVMLMCAIVVLLVLALKFVKVHVTKNQIVCILVQPVTNASQTHAKKVDVVLLAMKTFIVWDKETAQHASTLCVLSLVVADALVPVIAMVFQLVVDNA